MSAIFVNQAAKSKALAWFETFRAALPVAAVETAVLERDWLTAMDGFRAALR